MTRRLTALAVSGFLALAGPAWVSGQDEGSKATKTVKKEDVKTWTETIDGKEWSMRLATPSYEGDTGLFRLSSAYVLPKGKAAFSLFRDNYDRDPKGIDFSIHGLNAAYAATDKLEIFGQVGLQNRTKVNYPAQLGYYNDLPFAIDSWQTGFGDIKAGVKFAFLDDYRGDGVGLALRGLVKFGTADEAKGLGTGQIGGALDVILSKTLNYKADLHASLGYEFSGDPDLPSNLGSGSRNIGGAFKWGIGFNVPACEKWSIQAEVTGKVYSDADFDQTSTADLIVGPVIWIRPGLFIRPAWSYALGYDDRGQGGSFEKKSGKHISVGYHPGTRCCEVYTPPPPAPPPANRPPTVSLNCLRDSLLAGETTDCRATAADPDGDPLTYTWSASAGRVTGSGADAKLDTTGVPCGTNITVTVTVSDGRGGTASATDTVRVVCPQKPKPEAVTCTSGGFPRNLARLNNVDKACLDDVASKLRQDPRSRVVVVGHADKGERNANVVARKRAEAVKSYLVKERGIDEARITAREVGATRPLDTGTSAMSRAKNRRVDVVFVPEGATAPEDDD
jgi:outer membrane protein OmpA-like peptidoglycan-associated protein